MSGPERVVVVGDIAVDHLIRVDTGRARDEKVPVVDAVWDLGGTAANAAAQIVRLGSPADVVGAVGTDPWGGWLIARAREAGLGTDRVRVLAGRSTTATIVLAGARRTVYVDPGVGADGVALDDDDVRGAGLVYVSYAPGVVGGLVRADVGGRVVVGLEHWMLDTPGLASDLAGVRLVVTNEAGAAELARRAIDLPGDLVVTRGEQGATVLRAGSVIAQVAAPRVDVVDATGAGDAFAGALCHAVVAGTGLVEAVRSACVAGALATSAVGARAGQVGARELAAAMR